MAVYDLAIKALKIGNRLREFIGCGLVVIGVGAIIAGLLLNARMLDNTMLDRFMAGDEAHANGLSFFTLGVVVMFVGIAQWAYAVGVREPDKPETLEKPANDLPDDNQPIVQRRREPTSISRRRR
jgi:hypothetical protein